MKKKFYDVGTLLYVRNEKHTTGLILGAVIAGVAGLGAAGINAAAQSSANSANMQLAQETMQQQIDLFHEANQFNHDEAQISRDYNSQEARIAREFSAGEAEKNRDFQSAMIDKYNEYMSPSNQVARYMDAGINPSSILGNISSQGFSIPSGSAASGVSASASPASASGVPSLPIPHVNPVNYGDFAKVLGDAVNTGINASQGYEDTKSKVTFNKYYDELQAAGLNLTRQEARVQWAKYNEIQTNTEVLRKSVDKLVADIGLVEKQGQWYDKNGELIDEQKIGQHIDNIFKSEHWTAIINREKAEAGLTDMQAKYYTSFVKSEICKNYGAAAYSNSLAQLTAVEEEFKKKGMEDELNILKETRNYYEDSNKLLQVELEVANKTKGKRAQTELELLEWQNSIWYKGSIFLKNIMQPLAIAGGFYLGAKGMKGASSSVGSGTFVPYKGFIGSGQ